MSGDPNPEGVKFTGKIDSIRESSGRYYVTASDDVYFATITGPDLGYFKVGARVSVSYTLADDDGGAGGH